MVDMTERASTTERSHESPRLGLTRPRTDLMATVTHHIRSEYDPEVDKARLLRETGQPPEDNDDDDLWHTESSSAGFHKSNRATNPPKFVPALLSYDEWGSSATLTPAPEHTLTTSRPTHGDVASWYRSLGRQRANPTHQQHQPPSSNSHTARHPTPEATPDPPSSSPLPITTLASPAHVTGPPRHRLGSHNEGSTEVVATGSSHVRSPNPNPRLRLPHRRPGPALPPLVAAAAHLRTSSRATRHPLSHSDHRSSSTSARPTRDGPCCRTRAGPRARASAPGAVVVTMTHAPGRQPRLCRWAWRNRRRGRGSTLHRLPRPRPRLHAHPPPHHLRNNNDKGPRRKSRKWRSLWMTTTTILSSRFGRNRAWP
ncbi:hypothetical protein BC826DRAFT_151538 [Russula brevipes]|nr:hypothetical protein BC826DRAFT_151538 [Russula brevipes]